MKIALHPTVIISDTSVWKSTFTPFLLLPAALSAIKQQKHHEVKIISPILKDVQLVTSRHNMSTGN